MNLIFSIGSLNNKESLKRTLRKENAENDFVTLGISKLKNYRLAFTRYSHGRRGGVLDVIPSEGDYILGKVYGISNRGIQAVDIREGVHCGAYERIELEVELGDKLEKVFVYSVVDKDLNEYEPSQEYLKEVIDGMKAANFPKEYIQKYLLDHITEKFQGKIQNVDNVEIYDSSQWLDQKGRNVIGIPKVIRKKLGVNIGDTVVVTYNKKSVELKVYKTDKRLLADGISQADNPDNHVSIPKQIRQELGLQRISSKRELLPSFKKKFSSVNIKKKL